MSELLRLISPDALDDLRVGAVNDTILERARAIVEDVRREGVTALRRYAEQHDGLPNGAPLTLGREALQAALERISPETRGVLERTAERIRRFAEAQAECVRPLETTVDGGRAGHRIEPVHACGCYAPGGRFPLPSTVLMTAIPARVAGVPSVWVGSPKPTDVTLAAAAVADADGVLVAGGAQAIAAFSEGVAVPRCDLVVGPGNAWVTAAKWWVSRSTRIDMLAGPSELTVVADDSADAARVAADLLAQAEHDPDASPMLVCLDESFLTEVQRELSTQIATLPTRETAEESLRRQGLAIVVPSVKEAIAVTDRIAPEHLALHGPSIQAAAAHFSAFGAQFIGEVTAEVFADYGIGPNHVLPTGGTARSQGGLSVFTYLKVATWLELDEAHPDVVSDAAHLARCEGLEAHARAAERRN